MIRTVCCSGTEIFYFTEISTCYPLKCKMEYFIPVAPIRIVKTIRMKRVNIYVQGVTVSYCGSNSF